jgi:hypothetical protein
MTDEMKNFWGIVLSIATLVGAAVAFVIKVVKKAPGGVYFGVSNIADGEFCV